MDYTQRGLERLMTPGNHWDPATPGLVLRIRESGVKTWSFVYRMGGRASKKQWLKLGDFSALPLNRAQKRARDLHVQVENGVDPKDVRLSSGKKHFKGGQQGRGKRRIMNKDDD